VCTCTCCGVGRGAPTRTMRPPSDISVHMLRACSDISCVNMPPCKVAACRRELCDLRTRCEESAASPNDVAVRARSMLQCEPDRCYSANVTSMQQHMLRANDALLTRSRREPIRTMRPPTAMRRERGAPTRTKKIIQPSPSSGCVFILSLPNICRPT
jgi:hypothetical protein